MIDNFSVRWTKQETELLEKYVDSDDYEKLMTLLPGRSKASIKAKQKRLMRADPIPRNLAKFIFKYYLEGEAEGQILQRMMKAGHNYTLKDIGVAVKKVRLECEAAYAEERGHKPTLDQLREALLKNG
jgi:hypothetical protein